MWKLWLDDDAGKPGMEAFRNPPDNSWMVAHSSTEAIGLIDSHGPPSYISFDHDLGQFEDGSEDTAIIVIRYLTDNHYDANVEYDVHSRNPNGRANIISKMNSWAKSKTL